MPGKKLPESESVANSFQPVKRGKPTRTLTRQLQILQIRIFREINLDRRNGFFCAVDKVMATFERIQKGDIPRSHHPPGRADGGLLPKVGHRGRDSGHGGSHTE